MTQSSEPPSIIDVGRMVDERKLGFFHLNLLFWCFVAMLADGFDMQTMPYIATSIMSSFHLERAALGPAFSASFIGVLIGAPVLGVLGDHFGRRVGSVTSLLICAVFSLVTIRSSSLGEMIVYRFLTGIGIGGLFPNVSALLVEFAPKRFRAAFVVVAIFGLAFGTMLPGYVAAHWVPTYGWQAIFLVGGITPIIIAGLLLFNLTESIKYLTLRGNQLAVAAIARKIDPSIIVAPNSSFVMTSAVREPAISPRKLFSPGLAKITSLLWLICFVNLSTSFLVASWLVVLLQGQGIGIALASSTVALFFTGGLIGGVVNLFTADRYGALPITIMFALGSLFVGCIGLVAPGSSAMTAFVFAAGSCMMGAQYGINSLPGLVYPTAIRGNGAGWAQAMGRAGSSVGPLLGGVLVGMKVSLQTFFFVPAIGAAFGAVISFLLMQTCVKRFGSYRLEEEAVSEIGVKSAPAAKQPATAAPSGALGNPG
jgi:MFS transporter, AAHS family, 4-hydroxybenzoate transporter